jgi:hypothetical protein
VSGATWPTPVTLRPGFSSDGSRPAPTASVTEVKTMGVSRMASSPFASKRPASDSAVGVPHT